MNEKRPDPEEPLPATGIVMPDGSPIGEQADNEREKTRRQEDKDYIPVIIKRSDETRRHPDDALASAIHEGLEQMSRPTLSLLISAIAAGLIVGFSAMAVAVVLTAMHELNAPEIAARVATAFVYPLGFIMCVLSGAQLFTEHTASALYPVLDRKASVGQLLHLWAIVVVGNIVGAFFSGLLLYCGRDVIHAADGFIEIGIHLTKFSTNSLFISAVLAGWLMALGAWLAVSSPRTLAQITVIFAVTFLIGLGGLHHSIAGSVEMFAAMFYDDQFTVPIAARFIGVALVGNLIGGSFFVALLNYAHIRRTND